MNKKQKKTLQRIIMISCYTNLVLYSSDISIIIIGILNLFAIILNSFHSVDRLSRRINSISVSRFKRTAASV